MRKLIRLFISRGRERAPRHVTPPLVTYYYDGDSATPTAQRVRDISSTGLYLLTERRWYPGTLIVITLQVIEPANGGGENTIAVLAKVVRSDADGVSFKFIFTPSGDSETARNFDGSRPADKKALNQFLRRL